MFSLLFYELYGDPRDLHSFPTRRSSDLGFGTSALLGDTLYPIANLRAVIERHTVFDNGAQIRDGVKRDRKSTRLNSSHEWISYAVFCLKKKKKKKEENRKRESQQRTRSR